MNDYILVKNLRGQSWDKISNQTWLSILHRFIVPHCDSFSLDTIMSIAELAKISAFNEYQPPLVRQANNCPFGYSDEGGAMDHHSKVAVFELNYWAAESLACVDFNAWHIGSESSCADELLFWNQSKLKVQAVPYQSMIQFMGLSQSELKQLFDCEANISSHLYPN